MNDIASLIFEEWVVSLETRDKSKHSVSDNFFDLFYKLKSSGIDIMCAKNFLDKAVRAHQPSPDLCKRVFNALKKDSSFNKDYKKFVSDWNRSIEKDGKLAFFENYPTDAFENVNNKTETKEDQKKVYGSMSSTEYKAHRKYVDSYPTLDTDELEKLLKNREYNLTINDFVNVLENKNVKINK